MISFKPPKTHSSVKIYGKPIIYIYIVYVSNKYNPVKKMKNIILSIIISVISQIAMSNTISIDELKSRKYLDDYQSNVLYGYNIVKDTKKYAPRYTGNDMNCTSCHLASGTKKHAIPLNVSGMYPKWRDKNGRNNGIALRIRECFVYSLDGIMPPNESPEVLAVAAYISHLSDGEKIGEAPDGRGTVILEDTGFGPNPANGKAIYKNQCSSCHAKDGSGNGAIPPLWGLNSYNKGAGMHNNEKLAGWVWSNMPKGREKTLSVQAAKDVSAYINIQIRPSDPRESKIIKIFESILDLFGLF
jgi:thiosulfate dehydrogenase